MISPLSVAGKYRTASATHFQFGQKMVPDRITVEVNPSAKAEKELYYDKTRERFPDFFNQSFRRVDSKSYFFSGDDIGIRLTNLQYGYRYAIGALLSGIVDDSIGGNLIGGIKNAIRIHIALARVAHELANDEPAVFTGLLETNRHSSSELAHLNIGVFHLFLNKHGIQTNQDQEYILEPEKFEIIIFNDKFYLLPKEDFLKTLITESNNTDTQVYASRDDITTQNLTELLKSGTLGCIFLRQGAIPKQFFDALDSGIREACLVKK